MRSNSLFYMKPLKNLEDSFMNPSISARDINSVVKSLNKVSLKEMLNFFQDKPEISFTDFRGQKFASGDLIELRSKKGLYVVFVDNPIFCSLRGYGACGSSYYGTLSTILRVEKPSLVGVITGKKLNILITEVKSHPTPDDIIMEKLSIIFSSKLNVDSLLFNTESDITIVTGGDKYVK